MTGVTKNRVLLVAWEGADLDVMAPMIEADELPNISHRERDRATQIGVTLCYAAIKATLPEFHIGPGKVDDLRAVVLGARVPD